MEEPALLRTLQKAYCLHVMRILNKVEDTLANEIDELALTYLRTVITQLEKKREHIIKVDERIIELIQDEDDIETVILDAEELQDLILEKINELNKRVETLPRQATVRVSSPLIPDDKAPKNDDVIMQEESDDEVATKDTHDDVSTITSVPQSINTINSDTPVVCASNVPASNTVPNTLLTPKPVVSSKSLTPSLLE